MTLVIRSASACSAAFLVSYTTAPEKFTLKTMLDCVASSLMGACADCGEPLGEKLPPPVPPPPPPPYKPPESKPPETPESPTPPPPPAKAECPSRAQELKNPVGKILEGNKKITGYETVGKECLPVFENLNIPDQIVQNIPSAGMITVTASIAVVATTSALLAKPLADLLLKVVKPVTKKVVKKIAALRGKKPPVLSATERKAEQRDRNRAIKILRSALKPKG